MRKCDLGLIGLAVMGENLVLNMEKRGYSVAVYNRTVEKVDRFLEGKGKGKSIVGTHTIEELVEALESPRKTMPKRISSMLVPGSAVVKKEL